MEHNNTMQFIFVYKINCIVIIHIGQSLTNNNCTKVWQQLYKGLIRY